MVTVVCTPLGATSVIKSSPRCAVMRKIFAPYAYESASSVISSPGAMHTHVSMGYWDLKEKAREGLS
jgi:hypothetical protein